MEERAVAFVAEALSGARDWQEGQHALADNDEFHAWIAQECDGDGIAETAMCQDIIRKAEEKLGDRLPY
jgi:hypothetical protein